MFSTPISQLNQLHQQFRELTKLPKITYLSIKIYSLLPSPSPPYSLTDSILAPVKKNLKPYFYITGQSPGKILNNIHLGLFIRVISNINLISPIMSFPNFITTGHLSNVYIMSLSCCLRFQQNTLFMYKLWFCGGKRHWMGLIVSESVWFVLFPMCRR